MSEITPIAWDQFLARHPEAHILQSTAWGELKQAFGWKVIRIKDGELGAQILIRQLFPGIHLAYIPKGPIGEDWLAILPEIDRICNQLGCVFLKIEPDGWEDMHTRSSQPPPGFVLSSQSIQPLRTLIFDLQGDDQILLNRMKQKTRYNINLALKKGVVTHPTTDLNIFHSLIELTALREQFGAHKLDYYQRAYELFHPLGQCELFLAEYDHTPLAAMMVFAYGKRAWYFYGGSANIHRELMPNYLIQWDAMRWARSQGCNEYDFWGVPDYDLDTLEVQFANRSDGLWGVYRFKRGFGGVLRRGIGPWDRVYKPLLYRLYLLWQKAREKV